MSDNTPNAKVLPTTDPTPTPKPQVVAKPSVEELMARLDALEAKNAANEEAAELADPTYATVSDSSDKSRYFEVSNERYAELGFAGPDNNYSDTKKVNDLYEDSDDYEEGQKVTNYRLRSLGDEVVISYVLNGSKKGIYYLEDK